MNTKNVPLLAMNAKTDITFSLKTGNNGHADGTFEMKIEAIFIELFRRFNVFCNLWFMADMHTGMAKLSITVE